MQITGMDTLKTFRKQQRLLDVMLQCIKLFLDKSIHSTIATWHVQGVALKLFRASMPAEKNALLCSLWVFN